MRKQFWWLVGGLRRAHMRRVKPLPGMRWAQGNNMVERK
jgi:hypothetical protein